MHLYISDGLPNSTKGPFLQAKLFSLALKFNNSHVLVMSSTPPKTDWRFPLCSNICVHMHGFSHSGQEAISNALIQSKSVLLTLDSALAPEKLEFWKNFGD